MSKTSDLRMDVITAANITLPEGCTASIRPTIWAELSLDMRNTAKTLHQDFDGLTPMLGDKDRDDLGTIGALKFGARKIEVAFMQNFNF